MHIRAILAIIATTYAVSLHADQTKQAPLDDLDQKAFTCISAAENLIGDECSTVMPDFFSKIEELSGAKIFRIVVDMGCVRACMETRCPRDYKCGGGCRDGCSHVICTPQTC